MNSFSDIGTLNPDNFSRIAAEMTQGQRVMSVIGIAVARVGGGTKASEATGYNPSGVGRNINILA